MPKPLISIITPTYGRAGFLESLAHCVKSQTYGSIEWLVLDDSEEPSAALSALPEETVRYVHVRQRLSIGEKRNRLVEMAQGELIAHFDDDDYYGPDYLSTMAGTMEAANADFVRLNGFFVAHVNQGQIGYYRTLVKQGLGFEFSRLGVKPTMLDEASMPLIHLAYGWTYVYRKSVWRANPYRAINTFEDREFVRAASARFQMKVFEDHRARCMHSVHSRSSSRCFPQYLVPAFMVRSMAPEAIRHLASLRRIANGDDAAANAAGPATASPAVVRSGTQSPGAPPGRAPRATLRFRAVSAIPEASFRVVRADDFRATGPGQPVDRKSLPGDLFPYGFDFPERRRLYLAGLDIGGLSREPFIYMHQRSQARDVVSVPWEAGPLYPAAEAADPVFVFSPGRCGSTLLHAALNAAGALSLSEPDCYTQAVVETAKKETEPAQRAAIATALAHMTQDIASASSRDGARPLFIKLRSLCCANPALVLGGLKSRPRTVFLIRPLRPWLQSMARAFRFPASTLVQQLQQAIRCLAYLSEHTDCTLLKYDDLVERPELITEMLHRQFGLSPKVDAVKAALGADAQAGTPLARSRLDASDADATTISEAEDLWKNRAPRQILARLNLDHYLSAAAN